MLVFVICILSGVGFWDEGIGEDKEIMDMLIFYGKKLLYICFLFLMLFKVVVLIFIFGIGVFFIIIVVFINVYLIKISFWYIKRI